MLFGYDLQRYLFLVTIYYLYLNYIVTIYH